MPWYTEDINLIDSPHVVRMSFELPYLDWCKFEKSELFQDLTKYLLELEKQENPNKGE